MRPRTILRTTSRLALAAIAVGLLAGCTTPDTDAWCNDLREALEVAREAERRGDPWSDVIQGFDMFRHAPAEVREPVQPFRDVDDPTMVDMEAVLAAVRESTARAQAVCGDLLPSWAFTVEPTPAQPTTDPPDGHVPHEDVLSTDALSPPAIEALAGLFGPASTQRICDALGLDLAVVARLTDTDAGSLVANSLDEAAKVRCVWTLHTAASDDGSTIHLIEAGVEKLHAGSVVDDHVDPDLLVTTPAGHRVVQFPQASLRAGGWFSYVGLWSIPDSASVWAAASHELPGSSQTARELLDHVLEHLSADDAAGDS